MDTHTLTNVEPSVIEDLTGNIKRVVDGLATEIGRRVAVELDTEMEARQHIEHIDNPVVGAVVARHARQVLLDWFLGDFIPTERATS